MSKIAAHQFVKYSILARIPERLFLITYKTVLDRAVRVLVKTRSIEKAMSTFMKALIADPLAKQPIEVILNEVRENALRGLQTFIKT